MILTKIEPNYVLTIKKIGSKEKSLSVSFFSDLLPEKIFGHLNSSLSATYDNACNLELVIKNFSDMRILTKKVLKYHDFDIIVIKNKILKKISELDNTWDVKTTRYQITVNNKFSSQIDSKSYTFNSKLSLPELTKYLRREIKKKMDELDDDLIEFSNRKKSNTTHYVNVFCAGTLERRKGKSMCFSIYFPEYSSKQLIKIFKGENDEE